MAIDQRQRSEPRAEASRHTIGGSSITDWGRLQAATVRRIVRPSTDAELQQLVREAARSGTAVATRSVAHSAGGQSFCDDAIVVDMTGLDRVLSLDEANLTSRRPLPVQPDRKPR
jgi:FAD/FMN-containing dehydrogenase